MFPEPEQIDKHPSGGAADAVGVKTGNRTNLEASCPKLELKGRALNQQAYNREKARKVAFIPTLSRSHLEALVRATS